MEPYKQMQGAYHSLVGRLQTAIPIALVAGLVTVGVLPTQSINSAVAKGYSRVTIAEVNKNYSDGNFKSRLERVRRSLDDFNADDMDKRLKKVRPTSDDFSDGNIDERRKKAAGTLVDFGPEFEQRRERAKRYLDDFSDPAFKERLERSRRTLEDLSGYTPITSVLYVKLNGPSGYAPITGAQHARANLGGMQPITGKYTPTAENSKGLVPITGEYVVAVLQPGLYALTGDGKREPTKSLRIIIGDDKDTSKGGWKGLFESHDSPKGSTKLFDSGPGDDEGSLMKLFNRPSEDNELTHILRGEAQPGNGTWEQMLEKSPKGYNPLLE